MRPIKMDVGFGKVSMIAVVALVLIVGSVGLVAGSDQNQLQDTTRSQPRDSLESQTHELKDTSPTADTTPPEVSVFAFDNPTSSPEVHVTIRGFDNGPGMDYYKVQLDGNGWNTVDYEDLFQSYTFKGVSDGSHSVYVRGFDNASNMATDTVDVTVDTTSPLVSIYSPSEGDNISSTDVTVEWSGSDATTGIDHYNVTLNDGDWTPVGNSTSHTFTDLSDGSHSVDVRAVDGVNNSATATVNFTIDTTSPSVSISSPSEGANISSTDVTVYWSGNDGTSGIDHYEVQLDGNDWTGVGTSTSHIFSSLSDGYHSVDVRAVDSVGNTAEDSVVFTVDATSPSVSISSPSEGANISSTDVTVYWSGSDGTSGIDHYEVQLDGNDWTGVGTSTSNNFTGLSEGYHSVDVKAVDGVGNTAEDNVVFTVDTKGPEGNVTIKEGNRTLTRQINYTLNATDNLQKITSYRYRLNSASWTSWKEYSEELQSLQLHNTEGNQTLKVEFKTEFDEISDPVNDSITLDLTPPSGSVSIGGGVDYSLDNNVTLALSVTDNYATEFEMNLSDRRGSTGWIPFSSSYNWTFPNQSGEYSINVTYRDKAGIGGYEYSSNSSDSIEIDISQPYGDITIEEGDEWGFERDLDIALSAQDDWAEIESMRIWSGTWSEWMNYSNTYTISLSGNESGAYQVKAQFQDDFGQRSQIYNDSIKIDLVDPEISFKEDFGFSTETEATLKINGWDDQSDMSEMRIALDENFTEMSSGWISYRDFYSYSLPNEEGNHSIFLQGKTAHGQISPIDSKFILLDTTDPSGSVTPVDEIVPEPRVKVQFEATDNLDEVTRVKTAPSEANMSQTPWQAFNTSKVIEIENRYGKQDIFVQYQTKHGQVSDIYSTSVFLDNRPPSLEFEDVKEKIVSKENLTYNLSWTGEDHTSIEYIVKIGTGSSNLSVVADRISESTFNYTFKDNQTTIVKLIGIDELGNEASITHEVVVNIDYPPRIKRFNVPKETDVGVQDFYVEVSDPGGEDLNITWYVNGEKAETGPSFTPEFSEPGTYTVKVVIDDGSHQIVREQGVEAKEAAGFPWVIILIVMLMVIAGVGISYFFMKKKERAVREAKYGDEETQDYRSEKVARVYEKLGDTTMDNAFSELGEPGIGKSDFEAQTALLVGSKLKHVPREDGKDRYVWMGEEGNESDELTDGSEFVTEDDEIPPPDAGDDGMFVDELDLNSRLTTILEENGILSLEDLTDMSEEELLSIKNIGEKRVEKIKETLEELGYSLKK